MSDRTVRHVIVRIAPSGAWLIRDEQDHRGGRFYNRHAALQFIRMEFGCHAVLTFAPWPVAGSSSDHYSAAQADARAG